MPKKHIGSRIRVLLVLAISTALLRGDEELRTMELLQRIPIHAATYHVQGVDVSGRTAWITSVDRNGKAGMLFEVQIPAGNVSRTIDLRDGERYHPGGISVRGSSLWIPIAEYKPNSTSIIQQRNITTLQVEYQFTVNDHIGCVAATPGGLIGANWDATDLYFWDRKGTLLRKVKNQTGNAFQDIKFVSGQLVAGGLLQDKSGVIDWLTLPDLKPVRRVTTGKTERGVAYTHEGMAISDNKLWLLPEDNPSRLFVFRLRMIK